MRVICLHRPRSKLACFAARRESDSGLAPAREPERFCSLSLSASPNRPGAVWRARCSLESRSDAARIPVQKDLSTAAPAHRRFLPVAARYDPAFQENRHDPVRPKRQPQHWRIAEVLQAADFGAARKLAGHSRERLPKLEAKMMWSIRPRAATKARRCAVCRSWQLARSKNALLCCEARRR